MNFIYFIEFYLLSFSYHSKLVVFCYFPCFRIEWNKKYHLAMHHSYIPINRVMVKLSVILAPFATEMRCLKIFRLHISRFFRQQNNRSYYGWAFYMFEIYLIPYQSISWFHPSHGLMHTQWCTKFSRVRWVIVPIRVDKVINTGCIQLRGMQSLKVLFTHIFILDGSSFLVSSTLSVQVSYRRIGHSAIDKYRHLLNC